MAEKGKLTVNQLKSEVKTDVHLVELEKLLERLQTDPVTGLAEDRALSIFKEKGPNSLTPKKEKSMFSKFLKELFSGFSLLLLVGGALCFGAFLISYFTDPFYSYDNLFLGIILSSVVLVTTTYGFYQEAKSVRLMESFKNMIPRESIVIRNSIRMKIKSEKVVVGDVILLKGGDFIPADIRIIHSNAFQVDNSPITGESQAKSRTCVCSKDNFIEASNVAFAYTYATEGTCTGIVVATGDNTVIGRIAQLVSSIDTEKTTLGREIEHFIHLITMLAFAIGIIFFILSLSVTNSGVVPSIVFLIGIIVANVPEGLIITVTICLALTAKKMAEKNCLVKKLECVETLGSTSVICSDKTGTITQNRMTVSHLWYDNQIHQIGSSSEAEQAGVPEEEACARWYLQRIACICNKAEFRQDQDVKAPVAKWLTIGDASESAFIKYIQSFVGSVKDIRKGYTLVDEIPFDSSTKYHLCVHQVGASAADYLVTVKGAPEKIIGMCNKIIVDGEVIPLTDEHLNQFNAVYEKLGDKGERVFGMCQTTLNREEYKQKVSVVENEKLEFEEANFTFVGMISLIDPPRASVSEAVSLCQSAGIKVIMVTGDHPLTAKSIAKSIGILSRPVDSYKDVKEAISTTTAVCKAAERRSAIISGVELLKMTSDEVDFLIAGYEEIVFARTSPQQKLIIVEGFQRSGAVVAVTGDGVNDSPALRKANIGISMGLTGSDIAKETSSMVLLDDNFSSIVTGIREGRLVFDNLKKSIAYTLTSNIPEILPFILHILLQIPLPVGTITILGIDLVTDMVPAISLAYEEPESSIMARKPRDLKRHKLVNWNLIRYSYLFVGVLQATAALLSYLYIMLDNGFELWQLMVGNDWTSTHVQFIEDSYGQEWSYLSRRSLEYTCHSVYFFSIVIVQWADLLISKTMTQTIFKQGITSNKMMIFGLFFETCLSLIFTSTPSLNIVMQTRSFYPLYLTPALVYCLFLWFLDELRKLYIRHNPGGFIEDELYY